MNPNTEYNRVFENKIVLPMLAHENGVCMPEMNLLVIMDNTVKQ